MYKKPIDNYYHQIILLRRVCTVFFLFVLTWNLAQAGPLVYVANALDASVSVIDTDTNSVTFTIPVDLPGEPVAVAVHPFKPIAYVSDREVKAIHVINTTTHTETNTIFLDFSPDAGIQFHPDGTKAYVTSLNHNQDGDLSIIDTETETVTDVIAMGTSPSGVAIHPDGHIAYVCNFQSDDLYIVDLNTNTVIDILQVGSQPQGLTISPDGRVVYVPNRGDDTVSVIDTSLNAVIATIPVKKRPGLVAFLPDSSLAYVPQRGVEGLAVIDTNNHEVIGEIELDSSGYVWAVVTPSGDYIYLTNQNRDQVAVISTTTQEIVDIIPVGNFPIGLTIVPVLAALTIDRVKPKVIKQGEVSKVLTVTGTGFSPDIEAVLLRSSDININAVTFFDDNTMLLDISVDAEARVSARDLKFINHDGIEFVKKKAFRIVEGE
jgi:YVTN family beta-propeller protein